MAGILVDIATLCYYFIYLFNLTIYFIYYFIYYFIHYFIYLLFILINCGYRLYFDDW